MFVHLVEFCDLRYWIRNCIERLPASEGSLTSEERLSDIINRAECKYYSFCLSFLRKIDGVAHLAFQDEVGYFGPIHPQTPQLYIAVD